jgi:hypothetical protein
MSANPHSDQRCSEHSAVELSAAALRTHTQLHQHSDAAALSTQTSTAAAAALSTRVIDLDSSCDESVATTVSAIAMGSWARAPSIASTVLGLPNMVDSHTQTVSATMVDAQTQSHWIQSIPWDLTTQFPRRSGGPNAAALKRKNLELLSDRLTKNRRPWPDQWS